MQRLVTYHQGAFKTDLTLVLAEPHSLASLLLDEVCPLQRVSFCLPNRDPLFVQIPNQSTPMPTALVLASCRPVMLVDALPALGVSSC